MNAYPRHRWPCCSKTCELSITRWNIIKDNWWFDMASQVWLLLFETYCDGLGDMKNILIQKSCGSEQFELNVTNWGPSLHYSTIPKYVGTFRGLNWQLKNLTEEGATLLVPWTMKKAIWFDIRWAVKLGQDELQSESVWLHEVAS